MSNNIFLTIKQDLKLFSGTYSFLHIAQLMLFTMAAVTLISAALFFLGQSVTWLLLPTGAAFGVLLTAVFYGKEKNTQFALEIFVFLLLMIMAAFISGKIYDFSYDGNAIHKLAVGLIKNHWNPLTTAPRSVMDESNCGNTFWVESYCKFTWIFGAGIYSLTGNIETGKAYTILGIVLAFCMSFYYLKRLQKRTSFVLLFSVAAALSPIAVNQIDSFYNDGILHIMLYMLVISLLMGLDENNFDSNVSGSMIAASMIVLGNIKFTGLLYGGIYCIGFFILKTYFVIMQDRQKWLAKRFKCGLKYIALALVTMFWAGNTSYLTNLINHGTLTYPLTGDNPVDIMTGNSPFTEVNRVGNLFVSLFSRMDNFLNAINQHPVLKIPFTIDVAYELGAIQTPDHRLSGFGVLFSGIFLIAVIVIIAALVRMNKDNNFLVVLTLTILNFGLMFAIKESWWARYSPYMYFTVLLALFILLDTKSKWPRSLGILYAVLIIFNSGLFLYGESVILNNSNDVARQISSLSGKDIYLYSENDTFPGVYYNFKDKDVYYRISPDIVGDPDLNVGYQGILWKER